MSPIVQQNTVKLTFTVTLEEGMMVTLEMCIQNVWGQRQKGRGNEEKMESPKQEVVNSQRENVNILGWEEQMTWMMEGRGQNWETSSAVEGCIIVHCGVHVPVTVIGEK